MTVDPARVLRLIGALVSAAALASPQTGQYPTGQYPPSQYPSTYPGGSLPGGINIPPINLPKRKPKTEEGGKKDAKFESMQARLRDLGEREMLAETGGGRLLRFRLLQKTRFENPLGEPVRESLIRPGDPIEIRVNPDDIETAVAVVWLGAGSESERRAGAQPADRSKSSPPEEADFRSAGGKEPRENSDQTNSSLFMDNEEVMQNARHAASTFSNGLPDFHVDHATIRSQSGTSSGPWQPVETVKSEVVWAGGDEQYRNISINGTAANRTLDKSGAWTTGEFVTTILDLLSPATDATIQRQGDEAIAGHPSLVFEYSVNQGKTNWRIVTPDGRQCMSAYTGRLWLDKASSRVLKLEQKAGPLPKYCPAASAEIVYEYAFVKLAGSEFLMPVRSVSTGCGLEGGCVRNELTFTNYRK